MLARNVAGRIRQRPIEVGVAADVDIAPSGHRDADGTAIGKLDFVLDAKCQCHLTLIERCGKPCRLTVSSQNCLYLSPLVSTSRCSPCRSILRRPRAEAARR